MTPEDYTGRQEKRVWAIEQLIRMEGCLDNRMYECADHAASLYNTKNKDSLYTPVSYTHLTLPTKRIV